MDFRISPSTEGLRGVYYSESNRCLIFLSHHESLEDIYKTIQHEVVHKCIDDLEENETMDELQEERAIFYTAWAEHTL